MPRHRIYLFTYQRNELFTRAVQSLLVQTFCDWICEVHNDCPEDLFPANYITSLNDQRFIVKNHSTNLGPTVTFNLAFEGCKEDYVSILEDDNWWEPNFLSEMIHIMDTNPDLDIAWSNMNIWKEHLNNKWINTNATIWPENLDQYFYWPNIKQAMGALHSNGAMIYRGNNASDYKIPKNSLFNSIELIRERSFKYPIYLNSKPLANFSQTLLNSHSKENWKWTGVQIMLLSSFIISNENKDRAYTDCILYCRENNQNSIVNLILANMIYIKRPSLYKYIKFNEWVIVSKWCVKNLLNIKKFRAYLKDQNNVYQFLLKKTKNLSNTSNDKKSSKSGLTVCRGTR